MPKSAQEHLNSNKQPKSVVLEKDFAGIKKGKRLFVATPKIVQHYIERIPFGETRTIVRMRRELARENGCDASCPVSTSIFIRIASQAAVDQLNNGEEPEAVTPFWRLLSSQDKISQRLSIDPNRIDEMRELEHTAQL